MGRLSLIFIVLWVFAYSFAGDNFDVRTSRPGTAYKKWDIVKSRFGEGEKKRLLGIAYSLRKSINEIIVGQDRAAQMIQAKVVQYLEGLGSRTKAPVALHIVGPPGVGKSAFFDVVRASGLPVMTIDAQYYANNTNSNFASDLRYNLSDKIKKGEPLILLVEEIDKLPELEGGKSDGKEVSNSVIGTLNQILTDGVVTTEAGVTSLQLSNVLIMTTLNFSPEEIEQFIGQVLGEEKSFYDLTVDDFQKFDQWIKKDETARYKILSRMFRPNTVSRLAPNTIIAKPLDQADYREITRRLLDAVIRASTTNEFAERRLTITYSERLLDFISEETTFAPSGARETVLRVDVLMQQLIDIAAKVEGHTKKSIMQPREVEIDFDTHRNVAILKVTPKWKNNKQWVWGKTFDVFVDYDSEARIFTLPENMVTSAPTMAVNLKSKKSKSKITKKQIREIRFPESKTTIKGLVEYINSILVGQERFAKEIEGHVSAYLQRPEAAPKQPTAMGFAGFPGIGKTEIIRLTASYLNLPVIRINMQEFTSGTEQAVSNFIDTLSSQIEQIKKKHGEKAKYFVLIEEIDKAYEIAPDGSLMDRPVMATFKDLLNDGEAKLTVSGPYGSSTSKKVNIQGAFLFYTMNFTIDRFGFEADPRLTTVDDVMQAWKSISGRLSDRKALLRRMFLPDTVSRLMSKFYIMPPLSENNYRELIRRQVQTVLEQRFYLDDKNIGQVEIKMTKNYLDYLYNETVIPSEGARNTVELTQRKMSHDINEAMRNWKKTALWSAEPIILELDFKSAKSEVTVKARLQRDPAKAEEIYRAPVALDFPRLKMNGRMPKERIKTAVHEFGHAYASLMLGVRINHVVVVSPKQGVGGFVSYSGQDSSATGLMARIYTALASRAMERIFLSENPLAPEAVMDITAGPSSDILQATKLLFNMLHELGFNPGGGTMERMGFDGPFRYANFSDLPTEQIDKLGRVLREIEDFMVADFMGMQSRKWYIEKITELAREGAMDEKQFYKLVGREHPKSKESMTRQSLIEKDFAKVVRSNPELKKALKQKIGLFNRTTLESADLYQQVFIGILKKHFSNDEPKVGSCEQALRTAS